MLLWLWGEHWVNPAAGMLAKGVWRGLQPAILLFPGVILQHASRSPLLPKRLQRKHLAVFLPHQRLHQPERPTPDPRRQERDPGGQGQCHRVPGCHQEAVQFLGVWPKPGLHLRRHLPAPSQREVHGKANPTLLLPRQRMSPGAVVSLHAHGTVTSPQQNGGKKLTNCHCPRAHQGLLLSGFPASSPNGTMLIKQVLSQNPSFQQKNPA